MNLKESYDGDNMLIKRERERWLSRVINNNNKIIIGVAIATVVVVVVAADATAAAHGQTIHIMFSNQSDPSNLLLLLLCQFKSCNGVGICCSCSCCFCAALYHVQTVWMIQFDLYWYDTSTNTI